MKRLFAVGELTELRLPFQGQWIVVDAAESPFTAGGSQQMLLVRQGLTDVPVLAEACAPLNVRSLLEARAASELFLTPRVRALVKDVAPEGEFLDWGVHASWVHAYYSEGGETKMVRFTLQQMEKD